MTVNLHKGSTSPPTLPTEKKAKLRQGRKRGGGDFMQNAAEMFSFVPNPTRARNAWSSSTCLLYEGNPRNRQTL